MNRPPDLYQIGPVPLFAITTAPAFTVLFTYTCPEGVAGLLTGVVVVMIFCFFLVHETPLS